MQRWMSWILAGFMVLTVAGCSAQPVERIVEVPVEKIVEKHVDEHALLVAAIDRAFSTLPADYAQIMPDKLQERLGQQANLFVLDVRKVDEIEKSGKIAGSVNIPIVDFAKKLSLLPTNLNAPIAVYCGVGIRGNMALISLRTLGYTNVVNLRGGFTAWTDAKMPVVH